MCNGSMAYPYNYLEGSLVPLPIYAPQEAPYSIDDSNTPFEEWPVTARPATRLDTNMVNGPYRRYTSNNIGYLNVSPHIHWHPGAPLELPGSVPQFVIPPPDQWQGSTSPTALHMAPEMEPRQFYPLTTASASACSSLPLRGTARAPMVYEEYDTSHDREEPQDSLPQAFYKHRKNIAPASSRARTGPQRSTRARIVRTMSSRTKRYV